jgi:hypothetical protein
MQWIDLGETYWISAFEGAFNLECLLHKKLEESEVIDFETNFKPSGNRTITSNHLPFAAKTLPNGKKLYKRETGIQSTLIQGENIIIYTVPYNWVKMIGVDILYGEKLDKCDLMILDTAAGTYSTVPNLQLNQFGFMVNISEGKHEENSEYDADLYVGMQIKIVYYSQSPKTIGINFNLNEVK